MSGNLIKDSFKGADITLHFHVHFLSVKLHLYGTSWWSFN